MRCAIWPQLRRYTPLLEVNPERMFHRIGWKITPAQERIYGCILRARTLRNLDDEQHDGGWLAHEELALMARCDRASSVRAIHGWIDRKTGRRPGLLELGVLRLVPQWQPPREVLAELGYTRERTRNAYALGAAAWEPSPVPPKRRRGWGPPPVEDPVDPDGTLHGRMSRQQTPSGRGTKSLSPAGLTKPDGHALRTHGLPQAARNPELEERPSAERSAADAACGRLRRDPDPEASGDVIAGSGPDLVPLDEFRAWRDAMAVNS